MEATGVLTVLHIDDFDHHRGQFAYFFEDKAHGKRFKLRFEGEPPAGLRSGATVKVKGQARGQELFMAADGSSGLQTLAPGVAVVSGDQSTLVMVANFTDATVSCPVEAVEDHRGRREAPCRTRRSRRRYRNRGVGPTGRQDSCSRDLALCLEQEKGSV